MADQNDYNRQLIEEFRADRSKFGGRPLLLLTTMMYVRDGDRLMVIASNVGAPTHPAWYHNLMAHPDVTVEVGNETFEATAIVTTGEERHRLWTRIVELHPFFSEHQAKTTRQIPVIILERQEG
ncbi:MAG: nitroreductase family deazaflavin-dependent oxidoreductase [Chloroflexi bacterium]|nr:MAG: nitroreductase family deazaflavin-dependent oxidoreductase [Chloroflexota bacterium]